MLQSIRFVRTSNIEDFSFYKLVLPLCSKWNNCIRLQRNEIIWVIQVENYIEFIYFFFFLEKITIFSIIYNQEIIALK